MDLWSEVGKTVCPKGSCSTKRLTQYDHGRSCTVGRRTLHGCFSHAWNECEGSLGSLRRDKRGGGGRASPLKRTNSYRTVSDDLSAQNTEYRQFRFVRLPGSEHWRERTHQGLLQHVVTVHHNKNRVNGCQHFLNISLYMGKHFGSSLL